MLTGLAAAEHAGPAIVTLLHHRRHRLHVRRPVLLRVRRHGAGLRQRLCLRYATLGEFVAWFVGWNLVLEYMFAGATVAVGWSGYFVSLLDLFDMHLPDALSHAPFAQPGPTAS